MDDWRPVKYLDCMVLTSTRIRFFQYGLSIAAAEEFLTQGLLKNNYTTWIFTLIPFGLFLIVASCLREFLHRRVCGWIAPLLYYISMGTVGLAVEWFIIGLTPWSDRTSPLLLVVLFHSGMFSFWGTVALGPHILLDDRDATVRCSHDNPEVQRVYQDFLGEPLGEKAHALLHTRYTARPLYKR